MKSLYALLSLAAVGAAWYVHDQNEKSRSRPGVIQNSPGAQPGGATPSQPSPPPAAPVNPQGPILTFGGKITQHGKEGIFVHCTDFIRGLPPGCTLDDIRGDFLLIGYPGENQHPDGYHITFDGRHAGLGTFPTIYGSYTTLMKVVYVSPEERKAAAGPVQPKFGTTALDQRAHR